CPLSSKPIVSAGRQVSVCRAGWRNGRYVFRIAIWTLSTAADSLVRSIVIEDKSLTWNQCTCTSSRILFDNWTVNRIRVGVETLRVLEILLFGITPEHRVFRYKLPPHTVVVASIQVIEIRGVRKPSDVLPCRISTADARVDARCAVWIIIQRLHHGPAGIGDNVRASKVVRVYKAGLGPASRYAACGLLVDGRGKRIAIEDILGRRCVLGPCARGTRH